MAPTKTALTIGCGCAMLRLVIFYLLIDKSLNLVNWVKVNVIAGDFKLVSLIA